MAKTKAKAVSIKVEIPAAKAPISPQAALKDIKAKKFAKIYCLDGKEVFFVDAVAQAIEEHALSEADKGFNQTIIYGKDADIPTIVNNARKFPMMAERCLVIVREAQEMGDWSKADRVNVLINYLAQPTDSTILVFCFKGKEDLDKRKTYVQALKAFATSVACSPVSDNALPEFIKEQLAAFKITPNDDALRLIVENVGNNLQVLHKEIEKLSLNFPNGGVVTIDDVYKYVGISRDYNNYEFQKALASRDIVKANKILNYFIQHSKEFPARSIIPFLSNFYIKVMMAHAAPDKSEKGLMTLFNARWSVEVKDIGIAQRNYPFGKIIQCIHYLHEADLRSKGVDNSGFYSESSIMTELIFKLVH